MWVCRQDSELIRWGALKWPGEVTTGQRAPGLPSRYAVLSRYCSEGAWIR